MAKKAATATELEVRNLPVGDIVPTPDNPRVIDEGCESFRGLLDSVKASGVLVPGHVRPHPTLKGKWDLRCGARRHRASVLAGRLTMPCVVHATCSDAEAFEITFVENFARQDLSPLEEGEAVRILLDRFQGDHAAVADKLGKTRQWVALRERLGQLSPAWRKAIGDSANAVARWGASNLALIARLDREVQDSALDTLSRDTRYNGERFAAAAAMRPGQLDQWLNDEYLHLLKSAAWKLDDATLEPTAGACTECPKRSSCQTNLFHDGELADKDAKKLDRCLDAACWQRKGDAMLARRYAELKAEHPKLQVLRGGGDYRAVEREAQAMLGRKDLSGIGWSSSFEKATEGEKGAFPAVVLDGKGKKAQVQWLKKVSHASTPSSRVPKTAEEKQAEVEHRRRARAIERLQAAIPGVELSEAAVLQLSAMWFFDELGWRSDEKLRGVALLKAYVAKQRDPIADLREFVLANTAEALYVDEWDEAEGLAAYFGLPLGQYLAEAVAEIPDAAAEPKAKGKKAAKGEKGERACRICGCTKSTPCEDQDGEPCAWVEHDLCSGCIEKGIEELTNARYTTLDKKKIAKLDARIERLKAELEII